MFFPLTDNSTQLAFCCTLFDHGGQTAIDSDAILHNINCINLDHMDLEPSDKLFFLPDILWVPPELLFYIYMTVTALRQPSYFEVVILFTSI